MVFTASALGCAGVPPDREGWVYGGPDPLLKFPEVVALRGQDPKLGERLAIERFDAWKGRALDAVAKTKATCAAITGDPAATTFLRSYTDAFLACMRANGWSLDRSTNPLYGMG